MPAARAPSTQPPQPRPGHPSFPASQLPGEFSPAPLPGDILLTFSSFFSKLTLKQIVLSLCSLYTNEMTIKEIRTALAARGWTQKQLAQQLHIHPVTLGLILIGKNNLTAQLAAHIELLFEHTKARELPGTLENTPDISLLLYFLQSLIQEEAPPCTQEQLGKLSALACEFAQLVSQVRNTVIQQTSREKAES